MTERDECVHEWERIGSKLIRCRKCGNVEELEQWD